jgi:single-stranded DNA-binding protein
MNSFTFIGIGNLARNPEFAAKGDVAYVRFCLVGADYAEPDEESDRAREISNSVWFLAFDKMADRIATHARKGDQLIVTARIRSYGWIDKDGASRSGTLFIVTDFRFGAKGGPSSAVNSIRAPRPPNPAEPAAAGADDVSKMSMQHHRQFEEWLANGSIGTLTP